MAYVHFAYEMPFGVQIRDSRTDDPIPESHGRVWPVSTAQRKAIVWGAEFYKRDDGKLVIGRAVDPRVLVLKAKDIQAHIDREVEDIRKAMELAIDKTLHPENYVGQPDPPPVVSLWNVTWVREAISGAPDDAEFAFLVDTDNGTVTIELVDVADYTYEGGIAQ